MRKRNIVVIRILWKMEKKGRTNDGTKIIQESNFYQGNTLEFLEIYGCTVREKGREREKGGN